MALSGGQFENWKYQAVIKPLSSLGGGNGSATFFRGVVSDLISQKESFHNPEEVIAALVATFQKRAAERPEDEKSKREADAFVAQVRASLEEAIAKPEQNA